MSEAEEKKAGEITRHLTRALSDALKDIGQQLAELEDWAGTFGSVEISVTANASIKPLAGRRFRLTFTIDPEEEE